MFTDFLTFYSNFNNLVAEDISDGSRLSNLEGYSESPFLRSVADAFSDNVIGEGLRLQATPDYEYLGISEDDARLWVADVHERYKEWSQEQGWALKQHQLYKSYKIFGGALLFFQIDSADQLKVIVKDTAIIEVNKNDYPNGYYRGLHVNKFFEVDGVQLRKSTEYKIRSSYFRRAYANGKVTFIFFSPPDLAGQIQSQGIFSKLSNYSKQVTDYINFQVQAARIQAAITAFVTTNMPGKGNEMLAQSKNLKSRATGGLDDGAEVKPGTVVKLSESESVNLSDVNRTVPNIKDFLSSIAQVIGTFVGLPPSVILRSFDKSYSASRAEILESWKRYMVERRHFITHVQNPVYAQWLRKEIIEGRIEAAGYLTEPDRAKAWNSCAWLGVSQPSIDPVKDAKASSVQLGMGIVSRQTLSHRAGYDYGDEQKKIKEEEEYIEPSGAEQSFEREDDDEDDEAKDE